MIGSVRCGGSLFGLVRFSGPSMARPRLHRGRRGRARAGAAGADDDDVEGVHARTSLRTGDDDTEHVVQPHRAVGPHELAQRGGDHVAGPFRAGLFDGGARGTGR